MAGLKPMGYIVAENVRTETNGIIKKGEGAVKFYSGRKWQYWKTNGINKYSEGGSEILYWLELTGVKPMGSLTNEFGFRASENCQNWQN